MIQIKRLKMIKKLILLGRLKNNQKIVPNLHSRMTLLVSHYEPMLTDSLDRCLSFRGSKEILSNGNALTREK